MGTRYYRGNTIWIGYKNAVGKMVYRSTKLKRGCEEEADALLAEVERLVAAGQVTHIKEANELTFHAYAKLRLAARRRKGNASVADDESRLRLHVFPSLGSRLLTELRPRDFVALIEELQSKHSARDRNLAPKTIWNIYGIVHKLLEDAVAEELLERNPCIVPKDRLPEKLDADPGWRETAIFSREEVQALLFDARVPQDRRVLNGLLFVGSTRFGESAALRWSDYNGELEPLGKLSITKSYDTKKKRVKGTKTGVARQMPVHPALASILEEWRRLGWTKMIGHAPSDDDLIIPSRNGRYRNSDHMLKKFHADCDKLGLRRRRQHDLRRTFISLAIEDGARGDLLRWVTHGPPKAVVDLYTTLSWSAKCEEVNKLQIAMPPDALASCERAAESVGSLLQSYYSPHSSCLRTTKSPEVSWTSGLPDLRGGRDSNPRPPA